jgi:deoxyribodipyrimidine photo-lyase
MKPLVNIVWLRRDLRLTDNAAMYFALKSNKPVVPIFIFDTHILDKLTDKTDKRVLFIHQALQELQLQLTQLGSSLHVLYTTPLQAFEQLTQLYSIEQVYTNHDYEQYGMDRDVQIGNYLQQQGIGFSTYKDIVLLEKEEVLKDDGRPYTVFTPYSKKWRLHLTNFHVKAYPTERYFANWHQQPPLPIPELEQMGFHNDASVTFPTTAVADTILQQYDQQRDYPSVNGTSLLGIHLRFGTVSIRALARKAMKLNQTFLNELIWRDFYHQILWHFPHVRAGKAFKQVYDSIQWRNNEQEFALWCAGKTGYPIVDAGMRQLNTTGYMHNRVRMIVASFLTKHLLIDWRWGEAYFAQKLLDFDFAANNGGWQWAAGCGCDAAPYFRVFNPTLQTEKFDPQLRYIRKWVPELNSFDYPKPMVVHEMARKRALETYGATLKP